MDLGSFGRRPQLAEEVLVAMVRSIYGTWKLPFAFWLTDKKLQATDFAKIFEETNSALLEVGLDLRAQVTDGLQKNLAAEHLLGASYERPWYFLLLRPDGTLIDVKFIRAFVLSDLEAQPRMAPKVGKRHINPSNFDKMSVPLAMQLLSPDVAAGVMTYSVLGALPLEAMATGKFSQSAMLSRTARKTSSLACASTGAIG